MSKGRWTLLLLGALALLLVACSGGLGEQHASLAQFEVARSADVSESGEYLVAHNGALDDGMRTAIEGAGGTIVREIPQIGVVAVRSSDPEFADAASGIDGVTHVGPDLMLRLDMSYGRFWREASMVGGIQASGTETRNAEKNDLYVAFQWDIKRVGGNADTWAIQKGAGATVAVLDTGVYAQHPDIEPNYGYGKDLTDNTVQLPTDWLMHDQGGPQDFHGHGTHVAGTIAATMEAGRIVGVAPEASIANYKVFVAVRVPEYEHEYWEFDDVAVGLVSWMVQGIVTAADDGVNVINTSLGWYAFTNQPGSAAAYVAYLRATQYAREQGALVVAPSGDDGLNLMRGRASFRGSSGAPEVMSINATGPDDSLAHYSNYGVLQTRVVGPGGDNSVPPWRHNESWPDPPISYCLGAYSPLNAWASGAGWVWMIGTSMAAPKVSGVAALVYAQNPGILPGEVEDRLVQSADPIEGRGRHPKFGHGMVHAYRALTNPHD